MVRALQREGWYIFNQLGSHVELRHPDYGGRKVTVPLHRGRTFRIATVYSIRQAGITADQLRELLQVRKLKLKYTVVLEPDQEEGGYTVTVPALPGCISQGDTLDEALENIKEAIELYIDSCRKAGEDIPIERAVPQLSKVEVNI